MKTIGECLMMQKKAEQMELACRLGLDRLRQSAKKADWAAHIEKGMLAEPVRVRMLLRREWIKAVRDHLAEGNSVSMETLQENEDLLNAVVELDRCGLIWYEANCWHIQPCVRGMLEMSPQQEADHHACDVMADLIEGWLLHVGMMHLFRLVDWLLAAMGAEGGAAEEIQRTILAVLIARRGSACIYHDDENHLWAVHEDVEDPDALLQRLRVPGVAELDYPAFTAEALVFSGAYSHLPGDMKLYEPIMNWLDAHDVDDDRFEDALADLVFLTQNDEHDEAMESMMSIVPPDSLKDARRCCDAMMQVMNRIPLWVNKGHSAEELHRMYAGQKKAVPMPGRNDSCPCGSGKKYKQCCGKRLN